MTPLASHPGSRSRGLTPAAAPPVVQSAPLHYPTTATERLLLMAPIILLPLQHHIPDVAGISSLFIVFGLLVIYVFANRLRALARVWLHPVFLAAYVLLAVSSLMEIAHPLSDFSEIFRMGAMVAGAVCVASLCRDRQALRAGFYGYVIASLWLALFLFITTHGKFQEFEDTEAGNFYEATKVRAEVYADKPLEDNLNTTSFLTGQGAVVALALALAARSLRRRNLFLGIAVLCAVAAFLPLSRSGIITLSVSCAIVMFAHGVNVRTLGIAVLLGACVVMWAPEAAFSRFTFSTQAREQGKVEGRARVYTADFKNLPEYVLTGVGYGTFTSGWGLSHGWHNKNHTVTLAHNCYIQETINWGLPGLFALIVVFCQAYRCFPKRCGVDDLSLCLLGIVVTLIFLSLVSHRLHGKEFSLGLGLLVGSRIWIWPQGIVAGVAQKQWRFSHIRKPARPAVAFSGR